MTERKTHFGGRVAPFKTGTRPGQVIARSTDVAPSFPDLFSLASAQRREQGVKKGSRVNGKGPYQLACDDCGAHGQSNAIQPDHLWWHFPDALSMRDMLRMVENGPTHKIVGCGICGSHKLKGVLFADPII